jgi:hypothetical protein
VELARSFLFSLLHAVALTSDPEERLVRKVSRALCAVVTLPELSAVPIWESSLVNDELSVLFEVLLDEVLLDDALLDVEPLLVSSKLVSES